MERELLLAVKDRDYSMQRVENEIEVVKRILPFIESCDTFCRNNDVFDNRKHKLVSNRSKLRTFFGSGAANNTRYFIICKN
jgi:hypothetical protein